VLAPARARRDPSRVPGTWIAWLALALVALYVVARPGNVVARTFLRPLVRLVYDLRVIGGERVPREGGALLVANHVSYADAFLLGAAVARPVRYLMHRSFFANPVVGFLARWVGAIPVASGDTPEERERALGAAAGSLRAGDLVGIFAEGRITRTGSLLGFRRGLETIASSAEAPIVPVALDEVWGSVFSFAAGRPLASLPRRLPYRVAVSFGAPLPCDTSSHRVRDELQALLAASAERRAERLPDLASAFLRAARHHAARPALVDERGATTTYAGLAAEVVALALALRERLGPAPRVGVALEAGRTAIVTQLALAVTGRAAVLFEPGGRPDELARAAGIDTLLVDRGGRAPQGVSALEADTLIDGLSLEARALGVRLAAASPRRRARALGPRPAAQDALVVLGTHPPEGAGRAVVLAQRSVASNVRALAQIAQIDARDVVLAALPPTQAYGVTVCLWTPLTCGACVVLPPAGGDARELARTVRERGVTGLVATPGMYRDWLGAFERADLGRVRLAISGGSHLDDDVRRRWRDALGCALHEGYGLTEAGPVVSVNLPDVVRGGVTQENHREGTVGRALPGTAVRVVRDDGTLADADELGRVLVRGPGRMLGYLGEERALEPGAPDGWIDTGDRGALDRDGFLRVTGRA